MRLPPHTVLFPYLLREPYMRLLPHKVLSLVSIIGLGIKPLSMHVRPAYIEKYFASRAVSNIVLALREITARRVERTAH